MSVGFQKPSEYSTGYRALALLRRVLEGFNYHPYFFMLRHSIRSVEPVHPFAHQIELLLHLLPRNPIRALIGDEIGLGKTVEAIMIMKYLRELGLVRRALLLVPRALVEQWRSELARFGVDDVYLIERDTIGRISSQGFPEGVYIASIDLIKRKDYVDYVTSVEWDLMIVDEAHRVGRVGGRETLRYELVTKLNKLKKHLLLLTATPHRGRPEDYVERLKIVDPHIRVDAREPNIESFYRLINGRLVFRRTKVDVNTIYEKRDVFRQCRFVAKLIPASNYEKEFHDKLRRFAESLLRKYYELVGEEPKAIPLLCALIAKRASSSPKAAMVTLGRIIASREAALRMAEDSRRLNEEAKELADLILGYGSVEDISEAVELKGEVRADVDDVINRFAERASTLLSNEDVETLKKLFNLANTISGDGDSRLKSVIELVKGVLHRGDRVVIFTEYRDTANYIYEEFKRRLPPEYSKKVVLVTSNVINAPEVIASNTSRTLEDVKEWLRRGHASVVISTDIASEGLNLQYANVVIHYEPTWSPIKLVQRIGRVWRLGQRKDVESYVYLLTVESDRDTLEILYSKLMAWILSGVETKPIVGERLELELLGERASQNSSLVSASLLDEKGRVVRYSEYAALITYLRDGRAGLDRYVTEIVAMLSRLKEEAQRAQKEVGDKRLRVDKTMKILGGLFGREAYDVLRRILVAVLKLRGHIVDESQVRVEGDRTFICGTVIEAPSDAFKYLMDVLRDVQVSDEVSVLIAKANSGSTQILYLVRLELCNSSGPWYSEVFGILKVPGSDERVVRGVELLKMLANIDNVIASANEHSIDFPNVSTYGQGIALDIVNEAVKPFTAYLSDIRKLGFSCDYVDWLPKDIGKDVRFNVERLGVIIFTDTSFKSTQPPPIVTENVERRAMEFVIEYEKRCGREPEDVSKYEHYDIRSYDPRTGEERFIEVKGRSSNDIAVELTETEFEYARNYGERYWLYIVYNIAEKPQLLAIRDPVRSARWAVKEERRYVFLGRKDIDI